MGKEYTTDSLEVTGTFCDYLDNPGTAGQIITAVEDGDRFDWETPSTPSTTYLKTRLVNTTIVNVNSFGVTACLNTTPDFSSGGISVTNSSNITVTDGGIYKVTAMVQADADSARSNLTMTVGVNGVFNQAVAAMGYVRNIVGNTDSSTTWTGILFIATNAVVNLAFFNTTNTRIISVIDGAKSSVTLHKIGPEII